MIIKETWKICLQLVVSTTKFLVQSLNKTQTMEEATQSIS